MEGTGNKYYRLTIKLGNLRTKYTSHRNFLILLSFIVGVIAALAAVALKVSVAFFEHRAESMNNWMGSNWLSAIFPLIGTGLSLLLLNRFFQHRLSRGIGFIIQNIVANKGRIDKRHTYGHILTAALTTGFGGSVGLEAPIVATGAAIGSNTGRDLRLSSKDTILLLACGTASGIAAVFNSPLPASSSSWRYSCSTLPSHSSSPAHLHGYRNRRIAAHLPREIHLHRQRELEHPAIPFYICLGIACGMVSVYVTHMVEWIEGYFHKKKASWKTWLLAGIPLCVIIFFLPPLYGEGYSTITQLLAGNTAAVTSHSLLQGYSTEVWAIILMAVLLISFKIVCAALTMCAGGNGGVFAPSMITGGITGFLFAYLVNVSGLYQLNTPNFIITAMAGVLAGVMHAPLTAIFLLAEISGGYTLFVPLMIVTAISYFITRKYIKYSVYHKSLVEKKILSDDYLPDHF